jgi:mRNA-degrading endonuclease RelE of RelBE toxin-antitoxin system
LTLKSAKAIKPDSVRLGEYWLIYEIDEANHLVLILKLDDRGDVY